MNDLPRVIVWRSIAIVSLVLAGVGVVLPVLPTVPFLIVAAWAGSKGWSRLEHWLLAHARYGPAIQRWRANRAVPRQAKIFAVAMMSASGLLLVFSPMAGWIKVVVPLIMAAVATWLWRLPNN